MEEFYCICAHHDSVCFPHDQQSGQPMTLQADRNSLTGMTMIRRAAELINNQHALHKRGKHTVVTVDVRKGSISLHVSRFERFRERNEFSSHQRTNQHGSTAVSTLTQHIQLRDVRLVFFDLEKSPGVVIFSKHLRDTMDGRKLYIQADVIKYVSSSAPNPSFDHFVDCLDDARRRVDMRLREPTKVQSSRNPSPLRVHRVNIDISISGNKQPRHRTKKIQHPPSYNRLPQHHSFSAFHENEHGNISHPRVVPTISRTHRPRVSESTSSTNSYSQKENEEYNRRSSVLSSTDGYISFSEHDDDYDDNYLSIRPSSRVSSVSSSQLIYDGDYIVFPEDGDDRHDETYLNISPTMPRSSVTGVST